MTALETAKSELGKINNPTLVKVPVRVSWKNEICLPSTTGETEEEAVFNVLTFGDNFAIDKAVSYDVPVGDGRAIVSATEVNEYRRLLVRRNLVRWTLDIPIERDDDWLTDRCWDRVGNIPAPLMEAFLDGFEAQISLTDKESQRITKESIALFSKHGRGVMDACEAVSLFCTLGSYWEKFGIDREKLPKLPYKEYLMLKIMIGKESEAQRQNTAPRPSNTKVAMGGRVRNSRGVSVPG